MDWPHSPVHRLSENGAYIVTCGTHYKHPLFQDHDRLSFLRDALLKLAIRYNWQMQAWSVLSNHYHFVALASQNGSSLPKFLAHLHTMSAAHVNKIDGTPGRKVWFQYWDTLITYEKSYFARLNYVHNNPVKHGLVKVATEYPWCSASWFERTAEESFCKAVSSFKTDSVNVRDDF
jgi:putative transposase